MSNSSPMPVPITCTSSWISVFESTLSIRFFSELMIFPRSGRIAWFDLSRASLAAPPAELPSTMNISASSGSRTWQSANFFAISPPNAPLRRVRSRAVRTALVRIDVVGEGVDRVLVRRIPLHRDLDRTLLALALEVGDSLVDRILGRVNVRDEVPDPALVVELNALAAGALVGQADPQPARQECGLAQALAERLVRPVDLLEDLGVGQESDRGTGVRRLADNLEIGRGLPAHEL